MRLTKREMLVDYDGIKLIVKGCVERIESEGGKKGKSVNKGCLGGVDQGGKEGRKEGRTELDDGWLFYKYYPLCQICILRLWQRFIDKAF